MKLKPSLLLIPFAFSMFTISGCASQTWYEGVKESAKNNCRMQPPGEVDRCLEKVNNKSYEEYEKDRVGKK